MFNQLPQTDLLSVWGTKFCDMKKVILFALLLVTACNKNDESWYWGEVSAFKNGDCWTAEIYAGYNKPYSQGIDIIVDRFNEKGFHREGIFIYKVPEQVGRYKLEHTEVREFDGLVGSKYYKSIDDGDVAGGTYTLLLNDSISDFVEITEIDGREIRGNFQMSFVNNNSIPPDTIVFLDGKFHTRLVDLE